MMNNCSACKWWYHDPDPDDKDREWGSCELATSKREHPEHPESRAVAQDHEGWRAWLKTHPDFGCNQWAAKVFNTPDDIHEETIRAMNRLDNILATALPDGYKYEIIQRNNRIIYTLIRDGRDYGFEIGWFVEDVNRVKTQHIDQCLKEKIAIIEAVDHKPIDDEYGWAFNPLDYQRATN